MAQAAFLDQNYGGLFTANPYYKHGCRLGWMLDPDDYSVVIFAPHQEPSVCRGDCQLSTLSGVHFNFTAEPIFAWLKIGNR
ncbi:MAG: hypothetical protein NW237_15445 [Cyanobacteriota bacterium]|nr:hypothetical protein [Cyanobacteriota bacterium]